MALADRNGKVVTSDGFVINTNINEIVFQNFADLEQQTYYWVLPPRFRGNLVCIDLNWYFLPLFNTLVSFWWTVAGFICNVENYTLL